MNPLCTAKSQRSGEPCKLPAMNGGTVCGSHGGQAPQTKARAAERIRELVHPALDRLARLIDSDDERVALGAIKEVMSIIPTDPKTGTAADLPAKAKVEEWITELQAQEDSPITADHVRAEIERLEAEFEIEKGSKGPSLS